MRHNLANKSLMIEIYKVRLEILKAKIENKPPLVIQKLHQRLDKLLEQANPHQKSSRKLT